MEKEPLRVAHIVGKWVGGGVEAVIMNYYKYIDKNKIQFDFICDSDSTNIPYKDIEILGGKVILIPPYQNIFNYLFCLNKLFKQSDYEIVHSHINALSVFPLLVAKNAGIKVRIAHSHSTTNKAEWKKNILKQILRPFSKLFATDYMACSDVAGKWLFGNKSFKRKEIFLLNNAIELERFEFNEIIRTKKRKEHGISDNTIIIGHVGRFVDSKNQSFLLDLLINLKNDPLKLIFIGDGPNMTIIKEKVKKLELNDKVLFLGFKENVADYYNMFDIFMLPSLYEGLGMVLIEAQKNGLPCIASTNVPDCVCKSKYIKLKKIEEINGWVEEYHCLKNKRIKSSQIDIVGYDIKKEYMVLESFYIEKMRNLFNMYK